jgi:hypothetical protein
LSISSISSTLPFSGVQPERWLRLHALLTAELVLLQRRLPVENPPQRAGAEVVALREALPDFLGRVAAGAHRLRVAEPAERVEAPLQILALAARVHHLGNEQPAQHLGRRARQLALARAGFAAHQQGSLRRQRGAHGPYCFRVEAVN